MLISEIFALSRADQLVELAKHGAAYGNCGRMCSECAFKDGALGNNEEWNVEAAHTSLMTEAKFNCHLTDQNGHTENSGTPCVGFLYAKQYFSNKFK